MMVPSGWRVASRHLPDVPEAGASASRSSLRQAVRLPVRTGRNGQFYRSGADRASKQIVRRAAWDTMRAACSTKNREPEGVELMRKIVSAAVAAICLLPAAVRAEVVRFDLVERVTAFAG